MSAASDAGGVYQLFGKGWSHEGKDQANSVQIEMHAGVVKI